MRSDREEIPAGFTKADADKAETMEAALAGGDGEMRALAAPGCQVYWPAPYEVCGAIRDKYNALGGPNSFLLFPKTNEITNPDGIGRRTEFQNGPIYWSPQGGAHPVVHHFLAAWARHQYENGYIGYPTSDEILNPDGIGRRQHFTGSTIYWRLNEAYSVGGAIADKWHALGAERADGLLGYPISDERILPDGVGRMNRFERGVIYWHPSTGAHQITGNILNQWAAVGYETSSLGYPIADPEGTTDVPHQRFEHGALTPFGAPIPILGETGSFSLGIASTGPWTSGVTPDGIVLEDPSYRLSMNPLAYGHRRVGIDLKPGAPRTVRFIIATPQGFSVRLIGNTRLELLSPSGSVVGAVGVPVAATSAGVDVPVTATLSRNEVSFTYGQSAALARAQADGDLSSWYEMGGDAADKYTNLGERERSICREVYILCLRAADAANEASATAEQAFPAGDNQELRVENRHDATRHCTWQALLTERIDREYAEELGEAHELDWPSRHPDSDAMDRYNNVTGVEVGLRNEDNSGAIKEVCPRYAREARVQIPPPSTNTSGGTDLVILRDNN